MSESLTIKRAFDYQEGDAVEILHGENAGERGTIAGIRAAKEKNELLYSVYLPNKNKIASNILSVNIRPVGRDGGWWEIY